MKNIREICNCIADNLGILHPTCNLLDINNLWYLLSLVAFTTLPEAQHPFGIE